MEDLVKRASYLWRNVRARVIAKEVEQRNRPKSRDSSDKWKRNGSRIEDKDQTVKNDLQQIEPNLKNLAAQDKKKKSPRPPLRRGSTQEAYDSLLQKDLKDLWNIN